MVMCQVDVAKFRPPPPHFLVAVSTPECLEEGFHYAYNMFREVHEVDLIERLNMNFQPQLKQQPEH